MATSQAIQALEEAKCLEQEGQGFYRKAAKKTNDEKGREVFLYLAGEEANHERLIERQLDQLKQQGKWEALGNKARCNLAEAIFPPKRPDAQASSVTDDQDALVTGLEIETKSYDVYRKRAQEAVDPVAREIYEFLAAQERLHFDLLMTNYTSLSQFGGWSD